MTATASVTVAAWAKLTLSLRITGVRDDGYHLLDSEMVTIDLHDDVVIGPGDGLEIEGAPGLSAGPTNLVRRALDAAGRRAHVVLRKRIPAGAGLGGGSADAAAVLRWAGCRDLGVAARLGADVPFCLGGGRARVRGVGDVLDPLPLDAGAFTLVTPPLAVPTAGAYRMWDELGGPTGEAGNDLEPAALAVVPDLAAWRDAVGDATGERPRLAGSGSTWFVAGDHGGALTRASWPGGAEPRLAAVVHTVRGD